MSASFHKSDPRTDAPKHLQVRGTARWQFRTLLKPSPAKAGRLRWRVHSACRRAAAIPAFLSPSPRGLNVLHLRQIALSSAQSGDYEGAIATFNALLQACPDSAADYNNRGLIHFQAGHLDRAIADYNQALDINPELDSAYNNRANYYAARGNYLEAILDYDIALELNPINVRAWINQGITFRDLQMYSRAIENFTLALKFQHLEGHIYAERGRTHHLGGDWNWAIADYQQALQLINSNPRSAAGSMARLKRQVERWWNDLRCALDV